VGIAHRFAQARGRGGGASDAGQHVATAATCAAADAQIRATAAAPTTPTCADTASATPAGEFAAARGTGCPTQTRVDAATCRACATSASGSARSVGRTGCTSFSTSRGEHPRASTSATPTCASGANACASLCGPTITTAPACTAVTG